MNNFPSHSTLCMTFAVETAWLNNL